MARTRSLFDDPPAPDPEPESEPRESLAAGAERAEPARPHVLTVAQLTRDIRASVERLGRVSVEGEVSRITRAASGHLYFDLVDADAKLACVVWRSNKKSAARFDLAEGMQVVAHGRIDVYAPRGSYSLNVVRLEQSGLGALLVQFEQLKKTLAARGWFDRARPLPPLPRTIGVVTSRDGAAFRDFLRTRSLRWPAFPVRLAHTPVQGPGAAREIADAIRRLDESGVDVIVVCRGGGSLEDLWAFNELPVAEAIRAARVPVVCGVGHETDVTLADLVADHRAHTPTDAAQTAIPDRAALVAELERLSAWLAQALDGALARREERLERCGRSRVLRDARWITADRGRDLRELERRLQVAARGRYESRRARLQELHRRLQSRSPARQLEQRTARLQRAATLLPGLAERRVGQPGQRLELAAAQLDAYSPLKILGRGYSITTRAGETAPVRDAGGLAVGDELRSRLERGTAISRVTAVTDVDPRAAK